MGVIRLALIVSLFLGAGCLSSPDTVDGTEAPISVEAAFPASQRTFDVTGGTLAALTWGSGAEALVLMHGGSGVKENYWGALSVPDYSTGALQAAESRYVVGLDMPGYGQSSDGLWTVETVAEAMDEVAAQLRADGHLRVHGLGVSLGGIMLGITQGLHGSFDTITVVGAAPGAWSPEARAAIRASVVPVHPQGQPEPTDGTDDWLLEYANATVVAEVRAGYGSRPDSMTPSLAIWNNMAWAAAEQLEPAQQETPYETATKRITVPVHVIVGDHDWYFEPAKVAASCSMYAGPCQATVLANTGHMALHHENRLDVHADISAWLGQA